MKVKIELTVGDCAHCPYMDYDYELGTRHFCRHKKRSARYGHSIDLSRNSYDRVLKPVKLVEKFCPLGL